MHQTTPTRSHTWRPGDPLNSPDTTGTGAAHRRYLFNYRDDAAGESCNCSDAASWPTPKYHHDLDMLDAHTSFAATITALRRRDGGAA